MVLSTNSLLLSLSERFALIGNHFLDALDNEFVLIGLTFVVFFLAKMVQRRTGWVLFNPILITIGVMIAFLKLTGIQYDTYHKAGSQIEFWLKPAIVALGVPLYQQLKVIRKQLIPILLSQTVGCVVGIVSAVVTAQWLGASKAVVVSLAPKSVTTPIAMEVCRTLAHGRHRRDRRTTRCGHRLPRVANRASEKPHRAGTQHGSRVSRRRHLACHGKRGQIRSVRQSRIDCQRGTHCHPHADCASHHGIDLS